MTSEDPMAAVDTSREVLTWELFGTAARELAEQVVASGFRPDVVVAVARGGLLPGGAVAYALGTKGVGTLNVEFYTDVGQTLEDPRVLPPLMDTSDLAGSRVLVVDDVADSGRTLALVMDMIAAHDRPARLLVAGHRPVDHVPVVGAGAGGRDAVSLGSVRRPVRDVRGSRRPGPRRPAGQERYVRLGRCSCARPARLPRS